MVTRQHQCQAISATSHRRLPMPALTSVSMSEPRCCAAPRRSYPPPAQRLIQPVCNAPHSSSQQGFGQALDRQFVEMLYAYRNSGGLARASEILALFKRCGAPGVAALARWIVSRELICFEWQAQTWLPLFQFNRRDLTPDPRLRPVFAELTEVYDHWELATWFALPNPWLAQRVPVDTLLCDHGAVLDAARAQRFALTG
jgi:hypothetical protein